MTGLINYAVWTPHNRQVASQKSHEVDDDLRAFIRALIGSDAGHLSSRELYEEVPFVRAAVDYRARVLSSIPYTVTSTGGRDIYDSDGRDDVPKELKVLQGLPEHLSDIAVSLALEARAYRYKERRSPRGPIERLAKINPLTLSIDPDDDVTKTGEVFQYTRKVSKGDSMKVPREELLVVEVSDPYSEYGWGKSDVYATRYSGGALRAYSVFAEGHISAGLIKAILFSVTDPSGRGRKPGEAEEERLKDVLRRWLRERKASEKEPVVVSELLNVQEFGEGLEGLANKDLAEFLRQDVAAGVGVQYGLLTSSAANFATMQLDTLNLLLRTVFPDLDRIEDALNRDLLQEMGYRLRFEKARHEAVQFVEQQKGQALQALTAGAAILSVEEARETLGYEGSGPVQPAVSSNGMPKNAPWLTSF